jgi:proteasome activator subunit 4
MKIVQLLEDAPLASIQPVIEELLNDTDQNKQRGAAELLAGVIGGSKHWTQKAQQRLWNWFTPLIPRALGSNVKPDTLTIWTSFIEVRPCLPFVFSAESACSM